MGFAKDFFFKALDPLDLFKLNPKPPAPVAEPIEKTDEATAVAKREARLLQGAGGTMGGTMFTGQKGTAEAALAKIMGG